MYLFSFPIILDKVVHFLSRYPQLGTFPLKPYFFIPHLEPIILDSFYFEVLKWLNPSFLDIGIENGVKDQHIFIYIPLYYVIQ